MQFAVNPRIILWPKRKLTESRHCRAENPWQEREEGRGIVRQMFNEQKERERESKKL